MIARFRPPVLAALALLPALLLPGPSPAAAAGQEGGSAVRVAVDEVLKGAVQAFDGRHIEVHYDFKEEAQLEDFPLFKPFRLDGPFERKWWDRSLHLKGTGGVVWKVVLRKVVEMEFEIRIQKAQDAGAFVGEERVSEEYTLYSIFDQFFQNKDTRGSPKQHMICRFLRSAPDSGGDMAFRYLNRGVKPAITPGKTIRMRIGRQGADCWMEIDGDRMTGNESQWPALRGFRPGFYILENEAWIATVTLRGEVDPEWARAANVDLNMPVKSLKAKAVREPTDADRRALASIEAARGGLAPVSGMLALVENAALLDSVRTEAGKVLEDSGEAKLIPRLVPLLESPDLLCRTVADRAVQKLTGKSFGFQPDGTEERRRKAVRSLLDWIEKNPGRIR